MKCTTFQATCVPSAYTNTDPSNHFKVHRGESLHAKSWEREILSREAVQLQTSGKRELQTICAHKCCKMCTSLTVLITLLFWKCSLKEYAFLKHKLKLKLCCQEAHLFYHICVNVSKPTHVAYGEWDFVLLFVILFLSTIWKYACMYTCIGNWSAWDLIGSGGRSQVGPFSDTKDVWDFVDGAPGWIGVLMDERVYISTAVSERVKDCCLHLELQPV